MIRPIESEGWLLDPVRTRLWVADEDNAQVLVDDLDHWNLYAYDDRGEAPFYALENQAPAPTLFDTPLTNWVWGSSPGYNFQHWLNYGVSEWYPRPGATVSLEYIFVRKAVAPSTIKQPIVFVHRRTFAPMDSRAIV